MKRVDKVAKSKETKGLLPDSWDEKNIRNLIEIWNKAHPRGMYRYLRDEQNPNKVLIQYMNIYDHLDYMRTVVKQERKMTAAIPKRKGDPVSLRTSIPPDFAAQLRKAYPSLLTDKKQTDWFLRKFPEFNLER